MFAGRTNLRCWLLLPAHLILTSIRFTLKVRSTRDCAPAGLSPLVRGEVPGRIQSQFRSGLGKFSGWVGRIRDFGFTLSLNGATPGDDSKTPRWPPPAPSGRPHTLPRHARKWEEETPERRGEAAQKKLDTATSNPKAEVLLIIWATIVELPRFGGHLRIWEKGVHNGKESILVPA